MTQTGPSEKVFSQRKEYLFRAMTQDTSMPKWTEDVDWVEQEIKDGYKYFLSNPTIRDEVIERGMRQYEPYGKGYLRLWDCDVNSTVRLATYRLNTLIHCRETIVVPYVHSLRIEPTDIKTTLTDTELSGGLVPEGLDHR